MSIFDNLFGHVSMADTGPAQTELERVRMRQEAIFNALQRVDAETKMRQQRLSQQAAYNSLLGMGAAMAGSQAAYKPPPPPAPKHVGGDHPWQPWTEPDEIHGVVQGYIYRDLFIPYVVMNDAQQEAVKELGFDGWNALTLEARKDWIYLGARRLLITGS
jgi:hypothetical protein